MALADEIGAQLTAAGVASTAGTSTTAAWPLRYELQPSPSRMVAVIPSGGFQQEPRIDLDRPTFRVIVRGSTDDGLALRTQVTAVNNALNLTDGTFNGWTYVDVQRQGDALYLGRDENQRPAFMLNFLALRSRSS